MVRLLFCHDDKSASSAAGFERERCLSVGLQFGRGETKVQKIARMEIAKRATERTAMKETRKEKEYGDSDNS